MRLNPVSIEAITQETEHLFGCGARSYCSRLDKIQRGFTLVELIMTIVIVGILAVVAIPRFANNNVFQSRGFADQVQASLRYAQKSAIAQRRNVCAAFTLPAPSTLTLSIASVAGAGSPCDTNLQSPTGEASYVITAPAGVAFAALPADFSFNALGSPTVAQTINITDAVNGITIEADTGYVHSP